MICIIKNNKVFATHLDSQAAAIRDKYPGMDIIRVPDGTVINEDGDDPRSQGVQWWEDVRLVPSAEERLEALELALLELL